MCEKYIGLFLVKAKSLFSALYLKCLILILIVQVEYVYVSESSCNLPLGKMLLTTSSSFFRLQILTRPSTIRSRELVVFRIKVIINACCSVQGKFTFIHISR